MPYSDHRPSQCLLALFVLSTSFRDAEAQCVGWTFDRGARIPGASYVSARADRVAHVAYEGLSAYEPRVTLERFDAAVGGYVVESVRDSLLPHPYLVMGVAFDGTIAATHLFALEQGVTNAALILDLWAGTERATHVPLSTLENRCSNGLSVDVSGTTIAFLAVGAGSRTLVEFVERDATGQWALRHQVQSATIRTLSLQNEEWIELDGDFVAYGGVSTTPYGAVGLAERSPLGDWRESTILTPSIPGVMAARRGFALSGSRLALLHRDLSIPGLHRIFIFQRQPNGTWAEVQHFEAPFPPTSTQAMAIALSGACLAVGDDTETRLYELDAGGSFGFVRQIYGLGSPIALEAGLVTGWSRGRAVRTAPADLANTAATHACATIGEVYCGFEPGAPGLRVHLSDSGFESPRTALEVIAGPPNGAAVVLMGLDSAHLPITGGALCIEPLTLAHITPPFALDTSGAGVTALPAAFLPQIGEPLTRRYAQALTFGATRALSRAVMY